MFFYLTVEGGRGWGGSWDDLAFSKGTIVAYTIQTLPEWLVNFIIRLPFLYFTYQTLKQGIFFFYFKSTFALHRF